MFHRAATAALAVGWCLLAWAWVYGPAVLPYDPWGTHEPPGRPVSVAAGGPRSFLPAGGKSAWRRELVLHSGDRDGWVALHGVWVESLGMQVGGGGGPASDHRPLPGLLYRVRTITVLPIPQPPGSKPGLKIRPGVPPMRGWLIAVDLLWLAGVLAFWTVAAVWFWRRRRSNSMPPGRTAAPVRHDRGSEGN